MRLALFGSGSPLSRMALDALCRRHDVRAVLVPEPWPVRRTSDRLRRLWRERALHPLASQARARGIPVLRYGPSVCVGAEEALRGVAPDMLVVASFPYLLGAGALGLAPGGALNVHPSLLPRHRGPDPLFWTYFEDDRETGVTVHRLTDDVDAGEVVAQASVALERGTPIGRTYARLSELGTDLLLRVLEGAPRPSGVAAPPGGAQEGPEPRPRPGRPVLEPARLPSERVWHVLAGLGAAYPWLLQDSRGRTLPHGLALGRADPPGGDRAGEIERQSGEWIVHCADGVVRVARAPLRVRLRMALTRRRSLGPAGRRMS